MVSIVLALLSLLQVFPQDTATLTDTIHISSGFENVPHFEPHMIINPLDSDELLGLVGFPAGGFYAVWTQTIDGVLQLVGRKITF